MGLFRPRVFNANIEILDIGDVVEDQAPGNADPVGRLPPQSPAALSLHAHTHTLSGVPDTPAAPAVRGGPHQSVRGGGPNPLPSKPHLPSLVLGSGLLNTGIWI